MKVSFSTVDPKDFQSISLGGIRTSPEFLASKRKKREAKKERARLATEQRLIREEQLKNRLLERKCGNSSCKNIVEYVYDDKKSEYLALLEAHWIGFGRDIKDYLCPTCAGIQKFRLNIK